MIYPDVEHVGDVSARAWAAYQAELRALREREHGRRMRRFGYVVLAFYAAVAAYGLAMWRWT